MSLTDVTVELALNPFSSEVGSRISWAQASLYSFEEGCRLSDASSRGRGRVSAFLNCSRSCRFCDRSSSYVGIAVAFCALHKISPPHCFVGFPVKLTFSLVLVPALSLSYSDSPHLDEHSSSRVSTCRISPSAMRMMYKTEAPSDSDAASPARSACQYRP